MLNEKQKIKYTFGLSDVSISTVLTNQLFLYWAT